MRRMLSWEQFGGNLVTFFFNSNMTGRPGCRTMEMHGGSSASRPLVLQLVYLIGVETEGLLDYQRRAGIISIVQWNLRPVIFSVD